MRKRSDRIAAAFRKGVPIDDAVRGAIASLKPKGESPPRAGNRKGLIAKTRKTAR